MAGISSPARPWFKLAVSDEKLMDSREVKIWLSQVEKKMYRVFNSSNLYNNLHSLYGELGNFGIAPMGIFEDYDNVIHCVTYTVGSYRVASNEKGRVDVFYREYELTVDQMVKKWGREKCSETVRGLYDRGNTESLRKILHVIEPNDKRDHMSPASWNKKYRSVYIELEVEDEPKILSGFDDFPVICPRWDSVAEETYSNSCPAMDALGDIKALQLGERRSAQAIDHQVQPAMQAPSSFSKYEAAGGIFPGDFLIGDDTTGKGVRPVHDSNAYRLDYHEAKLKEIEGRINEAFYVDLFKLISNDTRSNITAREIAERHEEKLLMLGPVLERLHTELLDPLIDRTYNIMERVGIIPPPPDALEGTEISINYVSILAQAQRLSVINDINNFTGYVGQLAQAWPNARHKFNVNKAIDKVGDALSIDPELINDNDTANEAAAQEAQAQQMQQMADMAPGTADALKTVSEVDPASEMLRNMTGAPPA